MAKERDLAEHQRSQALQNRGQAASKRAKVATDVSKLSTDELAFLKSCRNRSTERVVDNLTDCHLVLWFLDNEAYAKLTELGKHDNHLLRKACKDIKAQLDGKVREFVKQMMKTGLKAGFSSGNAEQELKCYVDARARSTKHRSLDWLIQHPEQFPQVSAVYFNLSGVPASNAHLERQFAMFSRIWRADRVRLGLTKLIRLATLAFYGGPDEADLVEIAEQELANAKSRSEARYQRQSKHKPKVTKVEEEEEDGLFETTFAAAAAAAEAVPSHVARSTSVRRRL